MYNLYEVAQKFSTKVSVLVQVLERNGIVVNKVRGFKINEFQLKIVSEHFAYNAVDMGLPIEGLPFENLTIGEHWKENYFLDDYQITLDDHLSVGKVDNVDLPIYDLSDFNLSLQEVVLKNPIFYYNEPNFHELLGQEDSEEEGLTVKQKERLRYFEYLKAVFFSAIKRSFRKQKTFTNRLIDFREMAFILINPNILYNSGSLDEEDASNTYLSVAFA